MKIQLACRVLVFIAALVSMGCVAYAPYDHYGGRHHRGSDYQDYDHHGRSGDSHRYEHHDRSGYPNHDWSR